MDYQPKFKPQTTSALFVDGRADRLPVAGTVARGQLRDDQRLYRGIDPDAEPPKPEPPKPEAKKPEAGETWSRSAAGRTRGGVGQGFPDPDYGRGDEVAGDSDTTSIAPRVTAWRAKATG